MKFSPITQFSEENTDVSVGIRETLEKYLVNFKWFVLSILLFFIMAFVYVRNSVPQYNVQGTILIKDLEKETSFDKLSSIEDIGLLGLGNESLENEIQILKSRTLISNVVDELNLNMRYLISNNPYDVETYPDYPIIVNIFSDSGSIKDIHTIFEIVVNSKTNFDLIHANGEVLKNQIFNNEFKLDLGSEDHMDLRTVRIDLLDNISKNLVGKTIKVEIYPFNDVVDYYMDLLKIEPVNEKGSNVLTISMTLNNRQKGITIINNLIEQYNADGIKDKNLIAQATTDFLDARLGLIATELIAIEETAAQFKTSKGMINSSAQANYYLQSSTANEGQLMNANTQLLLIEEMEDELKEIGMSDLLPTNIGLEDTGLINMIEGYNELVLRRNRIMNSSSGKNPIIQNIDSELRNLIENLKVSLLNLKSSFEIQINSLREQSGSINSKIASAPKFEKEFKDIVRQQETKNTLYLFLLQKREESILSNAVKVNKSKVIDAAYGSFQPVSPKKSLIYLASLFLGIFFPVVVIYLEDLFDTKIHNEKDLTQLRTPYLGDVPLAKNKKDILVSANDRSFISESFRYLRTNINFMLDSKDSGKVIFVTSTLSGEGKSFTAINLARSLALSGKNTLLMGLDLRSPKFIEYLKLKRNVGVTNFIHDHKLAPEDILEEYVGLKNLFVITSGDIPPNPVELLMSKRVENLFKYARENFDYIVVDTAPVGLVTDTIQIGSLADLTIFVIKADYLDKRMLNISDKLQREGKLKNMAYLINGADYKKSKSYGYGYGYGYGNIDNKKWYQKFFAQKII